MTTNPEFVTGFDLKEPATTTTRMAKPKSDDTTVVLRGIAISLTSNIGAAFVADCSRNREKIFSDAQIQEKYDIDPADWDDIVKNRALRIAISRECERRTLRGTAAQEMAALEFTRAPPILGEILRDQKTSARHRIAAAAELRQSARSGDEKTGDTSDKYVITINLGNAPEDKLVFDCGPPKQKGEARDAETE